MSTSALMTTTTKMKSPLFFSLLLLFLFTLSPNLADCKLELELGYSVSTVIDFNKYRLIPDKIHPFSLLPRHRSTDLLLLDYTDSVFYSLPIPISQESEVSVLAGRGVAGFSDGDKTAAMFNKPRSFAIDGKDNVYVADRINHAIRKISTSGMTTTIAGGYSQKTGKIDGPAQNASFSDDFDLVYVPTICALLISDRGNGLIRQLDLKPEDCAQRTQAGLGVAPVSVIAVLCLLFGLVFGFVVRPFFTTRHIFSNHFVHKTWKHYRINLGRVVPTACSAIKSAAANSPIYHLTCRLVNLGYCYLSVVLRNIMPERQVRRCSAKTPLKEPVSILDSDLVSDRDDMPKLQSFGDHLQDLISFDEGTGVLEVKRTSEQQFETVDASEGSLCKIDDMINANLSGFSIIEGSKDHSAGLVLRRPMRDNRP